MNKTILTFVFFLLSLISLAQKQCVKHWSQDSIENHQLDTILSRISFENIDSTFCNYEKSDGLNVQWQIDFYNKQIGEYFSDVKTINFIKFYFREKGDEYFNEFHIIQFDLPKRDLKKFTRKFGMRMEGYNFFKINVFTLYKYLVKDNSVYFISTESYERGNPKTGFFFNKTFEDFMNFK